MNKQNREGDYYASKVRQYLNEYDGISLEDFCKAEKVSYTKMCNCLGRPSYRKPKDYVPFKPSTPPVPRQKAPAEARLPQMELAPLVIDYPEEEQPAEPGSAIQPKGNLTGISIKLSGHIDLSIGTCDIATLVTLMKEMEDKLC